MVKLQAIIVGALLACNLNAERILQTASITSTSAQSCVVPPPPPAPGCITPTAPSPVLNNNVVYGANNNLVGNLNTLVGSQNTVNGYLNNIYGNQNIGLGTGNTVVESVNTLSRNYNQLLVISIWLMDQRIS